MRERLIRVLPLGYLDARESIALAQAGAFCARAK
jgi:hypothetical protein